MDYTNKHENETEDISDSEELPYSFVDIESNSENEEENI